MNCVVLIPVGPGHEAIAVEAAHSVQRAWAWRNGPFDAMDVRCMADLEGVGRSRARNRGLDKFPADWHFLLDADDQMLLDTFVLVDLNAAATFGSVCLQGRTHRRNRYPLTRADLFRYGADGTLSMGCFVRGDLDLRFDETLDCGEDFDFYMRLPSFTKRPAPLVSIGQSGDAMRAKLAGRPTTKWQEVCRGVIERYRAVPA